MNLVNQKCLLHPTLLFFAATIDLVKQFEGFSANAYIDTSGLPVVGYGQTRINSKTVSMGQYITEAQVDVALKQELDRIQKLVQ